MSRTGRKRERAPRAEDTQAPTPERRAQGAVERVARPIADEGGRPAQPYRAIDTFEAMRRRGTITPEMQQAAETFRALFATAQFQSLRAADLRRLPEGMRDVPIALRQIESRKRVWLALKTLGGMSSPAGSCVWHVVGCEWTIREWALRQGWNRRPLRVEVASGILIGSLGVLQRYFGL